MRAAARHAAGVEHRRRAGRAPGVVLVQVRGGARGRRTVVRPERGVVDGGLHRGVAERLGVRVGRSARGVLAADGRALGEPEAGLPDVALGCAVLAVAAPSVRRAVCAAPTPTVVRGEGKKGEGRAEGHPR